MYSITIRNITAETYSLRNNIMYICVMRVFVYMCAFIYVYFVCTFVCVLLMYIYVCICVCICLLQSEKILVGKDLVN